MSDTPQEPTRPDTPPQGDEAPPQVDPIAAPQPPDEQPQTGTGETTDAVQTKGGAVDASEDPNLGHALEDQAQGVGIGPTQTSAQGEGEGDGGNVAGAI